MDPKLVLLMLLSANNNEPISGKTRLVKLMYILNKELKKIKPNLTLYNFYRYRYGPYSDDLIRDIEDLVKKGYISHRLDEKVFPQGIYVENVYSITEKGLKFLKEHETDLPLPKEKLMELVNKVKQKYNNAPLYILLRDVYTKYYPIEESHKGLFGIKKLFTLFFIS